MKFLLKVNSFKAFYLIWAFIVISNNFQDFFSSWEVTRKASNVIICFPTKTGPSFDHRKCGTRFDLTFVLVSTTIKNILRRLLHTNHIYFQLIHISRGIFVHNILQIPAKRDISYLGPSKDHTFHGKHSSLRKCAPSKVDIYSEYKHEINCKTFLTMVAGK